MLPFPHRPCNMSSNSWSPNVWTFVIAWLFCHVPHRTTPHASQFKAPSIRHTIENTSKSDRQVTAWRRRCRLPYVRLSVCVYVLEGNPWWSLITSLPLYTNTITLERGDILFSAANQIQAHKYRLAAVFEIFISLFIHWTIFAGIGFEYTNKDNSHWFIFFFFFAALSTLSSICSAVLCFRFVKQNDFAIVWFTDDEFNYDHDNHVERHLWTVCSSKVLNSSRSSLHFFVLLYSRSAPFVRWQMRNRIINGKESWGCNKKGNAS